MFGMGIEDELEDWQKNYLSPFCLKKCAESCCNREKTRVLMDENQLREAYGMNSMEVILDTDEHVMAGTYKKGIRMYWVATYQSRKKPYCPAYNPKTKECKIENNKPEMCKSYPVHLEGKVIELSSKCHAAKTNSTAKKKLIEIIQIYSLQLHRHKTK